MDGKKEYVERGALIDSFENCYWLYNSTDRETVRQALENAPIADVAPVVHGEWCWEGKFKACSECGSYVEWNETLGANFWKYCPYCGAKMDGGANNAENDPD